MRRLLPALGAAPDTPADNLGLDALDTLYAYPDQVERGRPWLRANMVTTLDGAAQAGDGLSGDISSPADKTIFGVLRALADVVLVGASTVRAEGYRPPQPRERYAAARTAAGRPPAPVIAVVSRSLTLDFSSPLYTEAVTPAVVVTCAAADPEALKRAQDSAAEVLVSGDAEVDLPGALDAFAARGWTRQLTEGGPTLLAQLATAGRLDELCLSLGPLIAAGDARRITRGAALTPPQHMQLSTLLEEDGFLFARYVRVD